MSWGQKLYGEEDDKEALRKFYQRERQYQVTRNRKRMLRNIGKFLFWFAVVVGLLICLKAL